MPYKYREKECLFCNEVYTTNNPNQKYCSHRCAGYGNNAMRGNGKPMSQEQKEKMSIAMKEKWKESPSLFSSGDSHSKALGKSTKGKHKGASIKNIYEVSSRTRLKIIKRLKLSCSQCGWDECICDIHHINGRKMKNFNNHNNLTYVCPNCHRKIHNGLIKNEELMTFQEQIGDDWIDHYYG